MATWTITIYNPDGTVHATGNVTQNGPGVGNSATIPSQQYSCTYRHTLTGSQTSQNAMSGTGVNPFPDPIHATKGSKAKASKGPGGDTGPSWDASAGGQPGPHPKPQKKG
ncbi:MAG: hypothetical protein QOF62_2340 [Pyrinomonadaceae bacterium]|jgi:hypothetical protein|nr:hypothetical protein [Pyrinomonadaceae bacterium]